MFSLNTILAWNINIIMNKKYDNNNIIIASRAYILHLYLLRYIKTLTQKVSLSKFWTGLEWGVKSHD
jgi:hypothetical protein